MAGRVQQLKNVLQLVAIAIFLIQMCLALEKYVRGPGTTTTEASTVSSISSPVRIAICRDNNPFNFSNEYGYDNPKFYFMGHTGNDTFLSWTGKNGNLTIKQTITSLFNSELDRIEDNENINSYVGPLLPFLFFLRRSFFS